MTNNKQNSIDWLWGIAYNRELTVEDWKQAKEMHKEEVIKAYNESFRLRDKPYSTAIKYYNETFGGNNE
jgi:hypothetical protein